MSLAITQYVLKVYSRCDLACDHCYVYEYADQSWRTKPRALDEAIAVQAALRISEHAKLHRLDEVHVVLHGGEPLLLGHDGLRGILAILRATIDPVTRLDLRIHTNAVRLDERLCALFADYAVKVGVSLDGDRAANDRHRRYANGRSSHAQVRQALALLRQPEYRSMYAGLLCTIDLDNDPIAVYRALLAEAPPRMDLLLPHATWDQPPRRPPGVPAPYAAWLGRIYTQWVADGCPVPIRFFDSLLAACAGRPSGSESVGLDAVDLLVIETDGGWEQTDSLKVAFDGAAATGMNVFSHSVDEAAAHPSVAARGWGAAALSAICRQCPVVRTCGGGLYTHRFRSDNGFDNPSVYCEDLKALISRMMSQPDTRPAQPSSKSPPAAGDSRCPAAVAGTASASTGSAAVLPRLHSLPEEDFDTLSIGPGSPSAMTALLDTRWSVSRGLVAAVASGLDGVKGELGRAAAEGWAILSALDVKHPEAVRDVMTYPLVQAWATQCLGRALSADPDLDHAHLAGLAAAAALRAGIEIELAMPVRDGSVYLPAIGALAVDAGRGRTVTIRVAPSGLAVRLGVRGWRTIRRVAAGDMSVTVEDVDPFRDCRAWAAAGRLSPASWRDWRLALAAAARQLAVELPAYAKVIGVGLRSVVPMRPGPAGARQSGTARQAFGALALALPEDVDALSELLLHEMQHVKLAALGDLVELFDRTDGRRFPVSWRPDHRPVEGLLHGTYAHLAIAELWRSRTRRWPDGTARQLFLRYRSWVEEAIETLLNSGTLMPAGDRFVHGMQSTVQTWA
jgi:uncharacterized protein